MLPVIVELLLGPCPSERDSTHSIIGDGGQRGNQDPHQMPAQGSHIHSMLVSLELFKTWDQDCPPVQDLRGMNRWVGGNYLPGVPTPYPLLPAAWA